MESGGENSQISEGGKNTDEQNRMVVPGEQFQESDSRKKGVWIVVKLVGAHLE